MINNPFKGRSTRTKIFTAISALAIVVLIVLNMLLFATGIYGTAYLDLSPEGLYTVRDIMYEECDKVFYNADGTLREPGVKITFCQDPDALIANFETRPIYHMAVQLSQRYPNLSVECVNIVYNPTAVADYKTTSLTEIAPTDVIVSYGGRYRIVSSTSFWRIGSEAYYSFDGEYKLASVLLSLTLINNPVAYFVTDHGEDYYDVENPESEMSASLGSLVDLLRERGLAIKNLSLSKILADTKAANEMNGTKLVPAIPEDCALLIINNPKTDLVYDSTQAARFDYVSETELLDRYMTDARGSIMLAKDYDVSLPNLEEFVSEWGMNYSNTLVKDPDQSIKDEGNTGTVIIADYNPDEESYANDIYGEYATLDSAPRAVISNTGHIECSFRESVTTTEPGSLNTEKVFAPLLYTSDKATDYAKNPQSGSYVDRASEGSRKILAAVTARQELNDVTAEIEFSFLFCAASADFFTEDVLGNFSHANYDVTSAIVQSISRLDTFASMELGGLSGNSYTGFGGKILVSTEIKEEDEDIYEWDSEGNPYVIKTNKALTTAAKVVFTCIVALIPLSLAVVGIVVRIKRKYK